MPYEKVGKNEPVCIADEVPFEIPDSWEWCRIRSVGNITRGNGIRRTETIEKGHPCIRYGEIYTSYNISFMDTKSFVAKELYDKCRHISHGDVVFTLTGENKQDIAKAIAYLGKEDVAAGGDLAYWSHHGMNPLYLVYFLASPYAISKKVVLSTGDIIVHISADKIGSILIPVPPIEEQSRIVAQINYLLPYLSEYESREYQLLQQRTAFPELLKKSILQEAVQGKLVPQDENDEPASVLLERIRAEKQALIKAGKIKKDKYESVIFRRDNSHYEKLNGIERCIDDEIPFEIPDGWEWVKLKNIAISSLGKTLDKVKNTGDFYPYLCSINVYWDRIDLTKIKEAKFEASELEKYRLACGDLLICEGGDVGRCCVWNDKQEMYYQNALHRVRFYGNINPYFFKYVIECYKGIGIIDNHSKGMTIKHLVQTELNNILLPLPPLNEQNRIVNSIAELFPYCEKL